MSILYEPPLLTSVPESRTASAPSAAVRALFSISVADSLPTPLVPSSGSDAHAVSAAASPAQSATGRAARRARTRTRTDIRVEVTCALPLTRGVGVGRGHHTRPAHAVRVSAGRATRKRVPSRQRIA